MTDVSCYVEVSTPVALAAVGGELDTLPLWGPPGDILGQRVAIVATGWSTLAAELLIRAYRRKFAPKDVARTGRVGTVMVKGYVQTEAPWSRKGIAGKAWPKRPVPRWTATHHWLIAATKAEVRQSVTGLRRLLVSLYDAPDYLASIREYGDKYGVGALPQCDRVHYERLKGGGRVSVG